jgi:hypothetical protein
MTPSEPFTRGVQLALRGSGAAAVIAAFYHRAMPYSRRWLETDVLPVLPALGFRTMLFVGAKPYTFEYEGIVLRAGGEFVTLDVDPSARLWGARRHVTAPAQQAADHFARERFDAVLLNGVFGFGIDTERDMNDSVAAVTAVLRRDGLLLVGWNDDRVDDPLRLPTVQGAFRAADGLPFPARKSFPGETHRYEFLRRDGGEAPPRDR